jgi:prefoldin beta subunit
MKVSKETQEKINQLQLFEQNINTLGAQKQQFQSQLLEVESAKEEIAVSKSAYKIIGEIMVALPKEHIGKELDSKKEMLELRLKAIEKQEKHTKEKASTLQKEILGEIKD